MEIKGGDAQSWSDSNELRVLSWEGRQDEGVYLLSSALWLPWFGGAVFALGAKDSHF